METAPSPLNLTVADSSVAWQVHLHPDVLVTVAALLVGYFFLIRRYGAEKVGHPEVPIVTRAQQLSFVGGVFFLWVSSGSPLHDIGENYLFSAHMLQHLIQGFVVAPLLILGVPRWMFLMLLSKPPIRRAVRVIAKPLVAGLLFNFVLMFIHWPNMVDLMLTSEPVHFSLHFAFLVSGIFMWLPIYSPAPEVVHKITRPAAMAYLFLMTFLPTVPASWLTFGDSLLYPRYGTFERLWNISAIDDMRAAGLLMKTGAGFFLWGIITVMFFRWASSEEGRDGPLRELGRNDHRIPQDVTSGD